MYAVIFRATIGQLDPDYDSTAGRLRQLAFSRYNCRDFVSFSEGKQELSISWWDSLDDIRSWREDPEHQAAQALGRERWYEDYRIEVVEVLREYAKAH
ncbi:MAG: antibiotic biosynthesis monooxygenase [Gammaproteobacteria bacterium]|jgi:heme-degrading monooxygenase HmoA|nr:MAG: antibiotic biosynthesis monooxygenase [Gammaproteobacteria bacterium]